LIDAGSLELMHARVQARLGERADETDWQLLQVVRDFATLLGTAQPSPSGPWLAGTTAQGTAAQIESTLRVRTRATVEETAGWMPLEWQEAVRWCAI
jgi:hypothetical protein